MELRNRSEVEPIGLDGGRGRRQGLSLAYGKMLSVCVQVYNNDECIIYFVCVNIKLLDSLLFVFPQLP